MLITIDRTCIQIRRGQFKCRSVPMNMSNQRMHWAVKSKWTQAWKGEVQVAVKENLIFCPKLLPLKKATIKIIFDVCHLMDHDGAYNAAKPLLDGLTECGVIIDDSPKYINLKVEQIKVAHRAEEKTTIEIN